MVQVQIKRVYEPEEKSDGFRVLTDRLWPRGVKKEDLHYDLWAKGIAPSTSLRQWFHQDMDVRWPEFKRRYVKELEQSPAVNDFLDSIKAHKNITLLYASKNTVENQALVLKDFIERTLNRAEG